jgi:serine/alanine adding enzyme
MPALEMQHRARPGFAVDLDYTDRKSWDAYVLNHSSSCSYHRYCWRDVVEKSFGHRCFYLAARDGDDNIAGVLPLVFLRSRLFGKSLVSLPFFNYGGVLSELRDAETALLDRAEQLREELGAEYVELRHRDLLPGDLPTKQHKVSMILDLAADEDKQWACFNAKLRNQIRKAGKSGLTVARGGKELLSDFYTVFLRNMRDLGTPVYAKKFFETILTVLANDTSIIAVYLEGRPIAAGLISWYRDTVEIPWASSIRDFNSLCPNNLLYWTALRFCFENGFARFDFGRSTPGEGTYKFKEQWGAKPVQLYWHYMLPEKLPLPEVNTKNPRYQRAIAIWQKLPLSLTRIIGPAIVKNIP